LARPAKTLAQRVAEGKFKAREHAHLLAGSLVGQDALRVIQGRWQQADSEAVRRAVALEYEKAVAGAERESPVGDCAASGVELGAPEFFERLVHTKGPAAGQPFRLEPWQRSFVEEFERRDDEGLRVFKRGLLGIARGNGKSPIAAGLALRELLVRDDSPDVFLAAASRDQARVVFEYARGFVEAGPLAGVLEVGRHEIRNAANNGVLRTISADGFVQHGLNPAAAIIDELHAFRTDKQIELFNAIDSAIHKRPDAYWLCITTASAARDSLLGRLHREMLKLDAERPARGLVAARDEWNGALLRWFGAEDDDDFDDEQLWEAVNPASWVTLRDLRRQRHSPSMSRSTFARLHLNAFVATDAERWIDTGRWEQLAAPASHVSEGAVVCVGADGSRSYDTTCVAWAARADDGRIDVDARIFSVRPEVPHHVLHAGTIDFADVEAFLLELASRFEIAEVRYDPRFLQASMDTLAGRLPGSAVAPVEPYSGAHRLALGAFERAVLDGTLRHQGGAEIGEQVAWCVADRFDNGDPRRIRKLDRSQPIDAAVALALAVHGAVQERRASVYDERGVIFV
jgi:phage terminase large subunit-like protein